MSTESPVISIRQVPWNCTKNSQLEVKFTWKRPEMNRNMRSKTLDLTNLLPFFLLQNDSIVATRKLTCHHFKWKIHLLSIIFEGSCHFSGEVGMPYLYLWITPNFIKPSFDPKGVDQSKQKITKTQKTTWNPKTTILQWMDVWWFKNNHFPPK